LRIFQHENIIELRNVIFTQDLKDFGEIYLITNLMEIDLYAIFRSSQLLTDLHFQFIIYQIVRALLYLHSANIVQSRLRPENILATETCDVQLCEFGLAEKIVFNCEYNYKLQENKYYQAPEMIVSDEYSIAVDMWSVGCILAELITGRVLFKGENYIQQIRFIVDILGKPKDTSFVTKTEAKKYLDTLPEAPKRPLLSIMRYDDEDALDLLSKLLEIDPSKRITAAEAIVHPYLRAFHDPTDEPVCTEELNLRFENDAKLTFEETLLAIVDEINYWKIQNNENEVDEDKFSEMLKSRSLMNEEA